MQKLHLVGFTADVDGLVFSVRKGAKSGSYVVPIDGELLKQLAEAERLREPAREEHRLSSPRLVRPESALSPREMQDRIRSGWSLDQVAAEAGVDLDWVQRFAAPVMAEVGRVVDRVREVVYVKPRVGESALPLGKSVRRNVIEKGVRLTDEDLDDAWSAYQLDDNLWVVRFEYTSRGRSQAAEWVFDIEDEDLVSRNRLASQLAHVHGGKAKRQAPSTPTVPQPTKATKAAATRARVTTAARSAPDAAAPARPAAKRTAVVPKAKPAAAREATPAPERTAAARKAKPAAKRAATAPGGEPAAKRTVQRATAKRTAAAAAKPASKRTTKAPAKSVTKRPAAAAAKPAAKRTAERATTGRTTEAAPKRSTPRQAKPVTKAAAPRKAAKRTAGREAAPAAAKRAGAARTARPAAATKQAEPAAPRRRSAPRAVESRPAGDAPPVREAKAARAPRPELPPEARRAAPVVVPARSANVGSSSVKRSAVAREPGTPAAPPAADRPPLHLAVPVTSEVPVVHAAAPAPVPVEEPSAARIPGLRPLPPPPPAPVPPSMREAVATPIVDDAPPLPGPAELDLAAGIARIDSRRRSTYVSTPPRGPLFRDVSRAGGDQPPQGPGPRPRRREPLRGR